MKNRVSVVPKVLVIVALPLALLVAGAGFSAAKGEDAIEFTDARKQTQELMHYNRSITLSEEQEAVRKEALTPVPAPCCSENSLYTCCCPCNMARTSWGLAKFLISEHGYDAEQVREKVLDWLEFIAPQGHTGDVCATGGCGRPFKHNGCGGMAERNVVWSE